MIKPIAEMITDGLQMFYTQFKAQRILKTKEEVAANTNPDNLVSAVVVGELNNDLTATDNKLSGCSFEREGNDFYIVGADSVRKKLGSLNVISVGGAGTASSSTCAQSFIVPSNVTKIRLYVIKDSYNQNVKCSGYISATPFSSVAASGSVNHTTNIEYSDLIVNPGSRINISSTGGDTYRNLLHIAIEL